MKVTNLPILCQNADFIIYGKKEDNSKIKKILDDLTRDRKSVDKILNLGDNYQPFNLVLLGKYKKEEPATYFAGWNTDNFEDSSWVRCYVIQSYIYWRTGWKNRDEDPNWWTCEGIKWYVSNKLYGFYKSYDLLRNNYIVNIIKESNGKPDVVECLNNLLIEKEYRNYEKPKLDFFMVKYLHEIEKLDFDTILNTEFDTKEIITKMYHYYNDYFEISKIPQSFGEINTPEQLLDYINVNFRLGYMKKSGECTRSYESMHTHYRTATMEEIEKNKILNCCDTNRFIKHFLDEHQIENKQFCVYKFNTEKNEWMSHFFTAFKRGNAWYSFEATNFLNNGIVKYFNLNQIVQMQKDMFWGMNEHVKCVDVLIPAGLSMGEVQNLVEGKEEYKMTKN